MKLLARSARSDPALAQIRSELRSLRADLRQRGDIAAAFRGAVRHQRPAKDTLPTIEHARVRLQRSSRRILALRPRTASGKRTRQLTANALGQLDQALALLAASSRTHDLKKAIEGIDRVLEHVDAANRAGQKAAKDLGEPWPL